MSGKVLVHAPSLKLRRDPPLENNPSIAVGIPDALVDCCDPVFPLEEAEPTPVDEEEHAPVIIATTATTPTTHRRPCKTNPLSWMCLTC